MDLLNAKVTHKAFGSGIVIAENEDSVTIQFITKTAKFGYPDAFESFLVAEDDSIQALIMTDLSEKKKKDEEKRKKKEETQKPPATPTNEITPRIIGQPHVRNIDKGFGKDYHVQFLAKQPILTYQEVEKRFGIKISGFGRGINSTSSAIVLISSVDKKASGFVYHDHWTAEGDYIYSGEGRSGDQTMTLGNKAIRDAEKDGKPIYLFVKFSPQEYYYQGIFKLADFTCEKAADSSGIMRMEYKFRLRRQEQSFR